MAAEKFSLSEWVEEENARGHYCQCGCERKIRVLRWHHAKGIPRFLRAHNPMAMTMETRKFRAEGYLTVADVAQQLGIGKTTLRRLEGKLFELAPRRGTRKTRLFTAEQMQSIRETLKEKTRLFPDAKLVPLQEVARQAGCAPNTLRRFTGKELPTGQLLAHPRKMWGFTPEEVTQIVAWVKQHIRTRRRGRRIP